MDIVQIDSQKLTNIANALRTKLVLGSSAKMTPKQIQNNAAFLHSIATKALNGSTYISERDMENGLFNDDVCGDTVLPYMFYKTDLGSNSTADTDPTGIAIPEKITSIGDDAFYNTNSSKAAKVIAVPLENITIGTSAFSGVGTVIYPVDYSSGPKYGETNAFYPLVWFDENVGVALYEYDPPEIDPETGMPGDPIFVVEFYDAYPVQYRIGDLMIPAITGLAGTDEYGRYEVIDMTEIPPEMFMGHRFRRITIPYNITKICQDAFYTTQQMGNTPTRIYIPSTCTTIESKTVNGVTRSACAGCEIYTNAASKPAGWNIDGVVDVHYNVSQNDLLAIKKGW